MVVHQIVTGMTEKGAVPRLHVWKVLALVRCPKIETMLTEVMLRFLTMLFPVAIGKFLKAV